MRAPLFLLALVGWLSCVSVPPAGSACQEGVAYCKGPNEAYSCTGGQLKSYPCLGPKGCKVSGDQSVLCDQSSAARPGDPCFKDYEGTSHCAPPPAGWPGGMPPNPAYLLCASGSWVQVPCPPGKSCQKEGGGIICK